MLSLKKPPARKSAWEVAPSASVTTTTKLYSPCSSAVAGVLSSASAFTHDECRVCVLVASSQLEFGNLSKGQMTLGVTHQTPTYYG